MLYLLGTAAGVKIRVTGTKARRLKEKERAGMCRFYI